MINDRDLFLDVSPGYRRLGIAAAGAAALLCAAVAAGIFLLLTLPQLHRIALVALIIIVGLFFTALAILMAWITRRIVRRQRPWNRGSRVPMWFIQGTGVLFLVVSVTVSTRIAASSDILPIGLAAGMGLVFVAAPWLKRRSQMR